MKFDRGNYIKTGWERFW